MQKSRQRTKEPREVSPLTPMCKDKTMGIHQSEKGYEPYCRLHYLKHQFAKKEKELEKIAEKYVEEEERIINLFPKTPKRKL